MNSILTSVAPHVIYLDKNKPGKDRCSNDTQIIFGQVQDILTNLFLSHGYTNLRKYSSFIGVCMPECCELVPIVCAIVNAGFAFIYIPVDESRQFQNNIIEDTPCCALISSPPYIGTGSIVSIGEQSNLQVSLLLNPSERTFSSPPLCYSMYTSGSTGPSKIVRVPFCCVLPNIFDLQKRLSISSRDVLLMLSPLTFDPCIVDILLCWYCRATLVHVSNKITKDPISLFDTICQHHATVIFMTPTVFNRFSKIQQKSLLGLESGIRVLIFGGEPCPSLEYLVSVKHRSNTTRLFNIYGTTEVSVWATISEIKLDGSANDELIPLGNVLSSTSLAVKVANQSSLLTLPTTSNIEGELYMGGIRRKCLIGCEKIWSDCPQLRPTGDVVSWNAQTQQIYFKKRIDGTCVKRLAMKIDLVAIEKLAMGNESVYQAIVLYEEESEKLYLVLILLNIDYLNQCLDSVDSILKCELPKHCLPDYTLCLTSPPMNNHGKVDKSALLSIVIADEKSKMELPEFRDSNLSLGVEIIFKNLSIPSNLPSLKLTECRIKDMGLDSLRTIHFINSLERWSAKSLPLAFQRIVEGAGISDMVNYIRCGGTSASTINHDADFAPPVKRARLNDVPAELKYDGGGGFGCLETPSTILCRGQSKMNICEYSLKPSSYSTFHVQLLWQWDSQKCIDASPVLLFDEGNPDGVCFICSHSGRLAALDASDGRVIWTQTLPGRLEASCALTNDAKYLIVGCYTGCVYVLHAKDGLIVCQFTTEDCVKCTPLPHPLNYNLVYFASHDMHLYCANIQTQKIEWKVCLDAGVVSSPCFSKDKSFLFAATLGSTVFCLNAIDGLIIWKKYLPKPIFATPSVFGLKYSDVLLVPCVDGVLYCLNCDDGEVLCAFFTEGPIFSEVGAVRVKDGDLIVVFGSSDHILRTITLSCVVEDERIRNEPQTTYSFSLNWQTELDSEITSTPYISVDDTQLKIPLVCCVSKSGTIFLLSLCNGTILSKYSLPSQSFSSPLLYKNKLFIGCRNNFMYCFELEESKVL